MQYIDLIDVMQAQLLPEPESQTAFLFWFLRILKRTHSVVREHIL
jgi:hypothetical protein